MIEYLEVLLDPLTQRLVVTVGGETVERGPFDDHRGHFFLKKGSTWHSRTKGARCTAKKIEAHVRLGNLESHTCDQGWQESSHGNNDARCLLGSYDLREAEISFF